MASVLATEKPVSPLVPIVNSSLDPPSSNFPPPRTTIDSPPSNPAAESSSPCSAAALSALEKMPFVVVSKPLYPSPTAVESNSDLEDGEIVEYDRPTIPEANSDREKRVAETEVDGGLTTTQQGNINAEAVHLPMVALEGGAVNDDEVSVDPQISDELKATVVSEARSETTSEEATSANTEEFPAVTQGPLAVHETDGSEEKEEPFEATVEAETDDGGKKEPVEDNNEEEDFGNDEDTSAVPQRLENAMAAPSRSVPPHMRPTFKAPTFQHPGALEGRPHWPASVSRAPRGYPPVSYQPSRPPLDYDELQRTKAQLMKARSDLDVERKLNAEMCKTVGAEQKASIGAAMTEMLSDLLYKQADALTAKAKTQEKERDLQYREQKIMQFETYLSIGQKQLKCQLEQQGICTMSEVDKANLRREVELNIKNKLSNIEGKIAIQVEHLRHQEAAQQIREQQYKALIRDALENEIREQLARNMQAKVANGKVAEAACERGLAEDKKAGGGRNSEAELRQEFLKGYAACHRTMTALHNVRNGKIAADSQELAFLYDPTHPDNLHNIGLSIGHMEAAAKKIETTVGLAISCGVMEESAARIASYQGEPHKATDTVTYRGCGQALFSNAGLCCSSQPVASPEQVRSTQQTPPLRAEQVQELQQEEPARSAPARSTFAGELRGLSSTTATPNGIFARMSNPQTAPNASTVSPDAPRMGMVGHVGEGIYAGRRIIRYEEDSGMQPAAPDLIDLY